MAFLLRRVVFYLAAFLAAATINFFLPRVMPGDPVQIMFAGAGSTLSLENLNALKLTFGFIDAMSLLALISLSLGIINLFPFLPLDGGHIFWAVAEKLRGRAISFQTMERAGFVGFVLVIALFVIGLSNDIDRLAGEGFGIGR